MSTELIKINPALLALVKGTGSLLPFAHELVVLECQVAGTSYQDLEEIEPQLNLNDRFLLIRESENKYDTFAVAIYTSNREKLGYLPRSKNETIARLLDAGKMIFAVLKSKQWVGEWLKMELVVWLVDG
jgi:hypothetical protein